MSVQEESTHESLSGLLQASQSEISVMDSTMSPRISPEPAPVPNFGTLLAGVGGVIWATGRPKRVISTGCPVFWTLSRTARQVALNLEMAISSTAVLLTVEEDSTDLDHSQPMVRPWSIYSVKAYISIYYRIACRGKCWLWLVVAIAGLVRLVLERLSWIDGGQASLLAFAAELGDCRLPQVITALHQGGPVF